MEKTPEAVLKEYWGYEHFRPPQREVIAAVMAQRDTLAVLPTGGGKSLCFQLPTLAVGRLCLVITPLISLMNDQVERLQKQGIAAIALHSGMSRREIDNALDRCLYGPMHFLYLSPERIQTPLFNARVEKMPVWLIAVDEAHCISEWGHDFRPSYRKIADLRAMKPAAACIALTATATPAVQQDITAQLALRKPAVFRQSFARTNLSMAASAPESLGRELLRMLKATAGSKIIYTRSRQRTEQLAQELRERGFAAAGYHAGMTRATRDRQQQAWSSGKAQVMVATNAFGMGIDKADVRAVIHVDLPESLEAYYQEAGRAGRDGKQAQATLLYSISHLEGLRNRALQAYPTIDQMKRVYQALANYYGLPIGSGQGESFDFDPDEFCRRSRQDRLLIHHALRRLEEQNVIALSEVFYNPSRIHFLADAQRLYAEQVADAHCDALVKTLLRLYGAELFSGFLSVLEKELASRLRWSEDEVKSTLRRMARLQLIAYEEATDRPRVTFVTARQDTAQLTLDPRRLDEQRQWAIARAAAVISYATQTHRCRMQTIQNYFGEDTFEVCGRCDVCLQKQGAPIDSGQVTGYKGRIVDLLARGAMTALQLEEAIRPVHPNAFTAALRMMLDAGEIRYDAGWTLHNVAQPT